MTLQERLDARGAVVLTGETVISQPLVIRSRTDVYGLGYARIRTTYNGPIFKTAVNEGVANFSIRDLFLTGGGIEFPAGGAQFGFFPSFYLIDNLMIENASIAFNDAYSGAWQGRVSRVFAALGQVGFRIHGGAANTYENCHAAGGTAPGWDVFAAQSARFENCSSDGRALSTEASVQFKSCTGLSVDGFYFEKNTTVGGALVLFSECDGLHVSGLNSLLNTLQPPAGGGAYLVQVHGCTGAVTAASLGGGSRGSADKATGALNGHTAVLLLTGQNHLSLNGCHIAPARKFVPSQTGFSYLDNSVSGSVVGLQGCRIAPAYGPGQIDPLVT